MVAVWRRLAETRRWQAKHSLEKVYGQADGQTKTDLLAEQRLWNSYKESSCNFYANGDWGREGQVLSYPSCRASVIEARTKQLQEYSSSISGN